MLLQPLNLFVDLGVLCSVIVMYSSVPRISLSLLCAQLLLQVFTNLYEILHGEDLLFILFSNPCHHFNIFILSLYA